MLVGQLSVLELILLVAMQRLKARGKEESLNFEAVSEGSAGEWEREQLLLWQLRAVCHAVQCPTLPRPARATLNSLQPPHTQRGTPA